MRIEIIVAFALMPACRASPIMGTVCPTEPGPDLNDDEVGEVGISPEDALMLIDGSELLVNLEPSDDPELQDVAVSEVTLTVTATFNGTAREETLLSKNGDDGPYCPEGPLMYIPVLLEVDSELWNSVSIEGELQVMGDEIDKIWVNSESSSVNGATDWLQDLADEVLCSKAERPGLVEMGFSGYYSRLETDWSHSPGIISVYGEGNGERCWMTLFRFQNNEEPGASP